MKKLILFCAILAALMLVGPLAACPPALLGEYNAVMGYGVGYAGGYGEVVDMGAYAAAPIYSAPLAYAPAVSYGYGLGYGYGGYGVGFRSFGYGSNVFVGHRGFNRLVVNPGFNRVVIRNRGLFGRRTVVRVR